MRKETQNIIDAMKAQETFILTARVSPELYYLMKAMGRGKAGTGLRVTLEAFKEELKEVCKERDEAISTKKKGKK